MAPRYTASGVFAEGVRYLDTPRGCKPAFRGGMALQDNAAGLPAPWGMVRSSRQHVRAGRSRQLSPGPPRGPGNGQGPIAGGLSPSRHKADGRPAVRFAWRPDVPSGSARCGDMVCRVLAAIRAPLRACSAGRSAASQAPQKYERGTEKGQTDFFHDQNQPVLRG